MPSWDETVEVNAGGSGRHTVLSHITLRYTTHFSSHVIRFKDRSFLYRKIKEAHVRIRLSRFLVVRLHETQSSNFLIRPKLTSRHSTVDWCTLKFFASPCIFGFRLFLMAWPILSSLKCDGHPFLT
ncbi:hypothetical protein TNCV_5009371 [Trichonephila clavipes]|nr:hypothetical protein TNCV_5009371 [Trichonephila clavipes]